MRISTGQLHHQALNSMQRQTAKVQQTELQIAAGLKILKPSDDPVGAVKVLNLNTNLGMVDQYDRNVAQAQSSLSYQESVLVSVNESLQKIRELTVQANNPANHQSALTSIGKEIEEHLKNLKNLANTRDAAGEYIFAGFRVDEPPFAESGGTVTYQGDQGQRMVQIGEGAQVAVRDAGDTIFMNIRAGDGEVEVLPGATNTGTAVIGQFGASGSFVPDTYTLSFSGTPLQYTVHDSATPTPNVVTTGTYAAGASISVNGAQLTLSGTPAVGDTFTVRPAEHQDIFKMVGDIASALQAGGNSARRQNAVAIGLTNLDQALESVSNARASVGNRLSHIDTVDTLNQDFKLQLETVLSDTEDLDYAEAVTRFNLQLTSLQAAQQAYIKTADLGLFRYL